MQDREQYKSKAFWFKRRTNFNPYATLIAPWPTYRPTYPGRPRWVVEAAKIREIYSQVGGLETPREEGV